MKAKIRDKLKSIKRLCTAHYLRLINIKFAIKNRRFWRDYLSPRKKDRRAVVLTEVSNNVFLAMGIAILANIIAKAKNATVLYLGYDQNALVRFKWLRDSFSKSYYESVCKIVSRRTEEIAAEVQSLYETLKNPKDVLELKYKGLLVGDLVYDMSMRRGYWQATVWKIDKKIYDTLLKVVSTLFALDHISHIYKVKAALSSHTVGFSGLLIRYFANQAVGSYCGVAGGLIRKYHSFNGKGLKYRAIINKPWLDNIMQDVEARNLLLSKANERIEDRLAGALEDWDSKRAFARTKKEYTSKEEFCGRYGLSAEKPCVFVMLHAFNDFPHHFKRGIFIDYYHWFIETLKIVRDVDSVNWIFKEHPLAVFYPNNANLNGIFELCDEPHILFLDRNSSFNPSSLRYIAHAIVTCLGTAGLEFSCFGIPAVLAADNHYSGFGICYEPQTYEAYRELLENIIDSVKPLDKETQEQAKILFYLLYAVVYEKTVNGKSFFCMTSTSHEERLENNADKLFAEVSVQLEDPDILGFLGRVESFVADGNKECFYVNEYLGSKLGWEIGPSE